MGSFANSLFKIMLGWLQTAVSAIWSAFTSQNGSSLFNWIGEHWILTAAVLCCAGLAADLIVYLLRWKPYKVWKSFLTRHRDTDEEAPEEARPARQKVRESHPDERRAAYHAPVPSERIPDDTPQEPDFSKWEEDDGAYEEQDAYPEEERATVTNAGYVVPADSPYRRPVTDQPYEQTAEPVQESRQDETYAYEKEDMRSTAPKRRRKLNVSDLFADPEEEIQQFDAPQHLIDSRKAYRKPVYPRNWENKEEN